MMCSKPRAAFPGRAALSFTLVLFAAAAPAQNVVFNEIMYHPASHDSREEYIELYNREATNVNLSGWALRGGVDFVIPANTGIHRI